MSNEITKEEWFRYIDEAVRHKDWKRRLFGKQSNYRKDKRKYSDRCRDCKWKPMIADANGSVGQDRNAEIGQRDGAFKEMVVPINLDIVLETSEKGFLRVVKVKVSKVHDLTNLE